MSTALFLGRFQPVPHKGHVQVIQEIIAKHEMIVIGLGSSQYSATDKNPLTAEERTAVFEALFDELSISKDRYRIVSIPDIHDNDRYVDHVRQLVPPFDTVYSGNELVQRLFHEKGFQVVPLERYGGYEGSKIRAMMEAGDLQWREMVPEAVIPFIT